MKSVERKTRNNLIGVVDSVYGEKSIKVVYFYKKPHARYGKEVKRKTVLHVHDEENVCKVGDSVEIMETRPFSKMKRWRVIRVVGDAATI